MKSLTFDISSLMVKGPGASIAYSFECGETIEGINSTKPIIGKVTIMMAEKAVNVEVTKTYTTVEMICAKCLEHFDQKIEIDTCERMYYLNAPRDINDPSDVFLINKKYLTVDISEMLRQELILHFPVISVCSPKCKGICQKCGNIIGENKCDCQDNDEQNKPLAKLKSLLK